MIYSNVLLKIVSLKLYCLKDVNFTFTLLEFRPITGKEERIMQGVVWMKY